MLYNKKEFYKGLSAGFDGLFEWDYLKPAWNGKIEPSDIDGAIERKDNLLLFETKKPGVSIPDGQVWLLEALIRIGKGAIEVMVLYDKTKDVTKMEHWYWKDSKIKKETFNNITYIDVIKKASAWFNRVNGTEDTIEWKDNEIKCSKCGNFYDPRRPCYNCKRDEELKDFIKRNK